MISLRNRAGQTLVELSIVILVLSVLTVFAISPPNTGKISDDGLKDLALTIDSALAQWYQFHGGVYPASLDVLIDLGVVPEKTQVEKLNYETASSNSTYRLVVTLKNGEWTSPGSKY